MATFWLQEAVRLPHVATYRLQETVGAEIVILVTITDEPPRARRLLYNGYKRLSGCSEDEFSDLTTNTWWLVGVGTILFFCMFLLTSKIYNQSKEIEELQLAGWKYRALRATLPANNANLIWLERNVWAGNKDGIQHCQQFVIRSTSGRLARPRTTRTLFVVVMRWNNK